MPNVFESVTSIIGSLVETEAKAPLHVGEVMSCWLYLTVLEEANSFEQVGLNTTTDKELLQVLNDAKKMCESQIKRLTDFMLQEGIPLPEATRTKPKSEPSSIPEGVKLTDDEIANGVSIKIAAAVVHSASEMSQSIRNDFSLMFVEFLSEQAAFGATLKSILKKRGWLKIPPYYHPPGLPNQSTLNTSK